MRRNVDEAELMEKKRSLTRTVRYEPNIEHYKTRNEFVTDDP